jgi:hypothetical protein
MVVELIDDVRSASDLTMDCVTARVAWSVESSLRQWSTIADRFDPDQFSSPLGRAARSGWLGAGSVARAVDRGFSKLLSAEAHGVADFQTGGCLLTGRKLGLALDLYFRPGSTTMRRHHGGTWREERERSAPGSVVYSPIRLVELLRGVTEATLMGAETVDGAPCQHLNARCDPRLAAQLSRHGMKLPEIGSPDPDSAELLEDERSVPTDLWIDGSGCLRRIRTTLQIGGPDQTTKQYGMIAELSLRDLGAAVTPLPTVGLGRGAARDRAITPPSP